MPNQDHLGRIVSAFGGLPILDRLVESASHSTPVSVTGLPGSARALVAGILARRLKRPVTLVFSHDHDARSAFADLAAFHPRLPSMLFDVSSPMLQDNVRTMAGAAGSVLVASSSGLASNAPAPMREEDLVRRLAVNSRQEIAELLTWLDAADYERVDLVTEPGEYTTRGGIVDIYPPRYGPDPLRSTGPVRLEFLDDIVVGIRSFDALSQRSTAALGSVKVDTLKKPGVTDRPAAKLLPADSLVVAERRLPDRATDVVLVSDPEADFDAGCSPAPAYFGNFGLLRSELKASEHHYYLACTTSERCDRIGQVVGEGPSFLVAELSSGFACPGAGFVLITERELYGTSVRHPARHRFKGLPLDNLVTLRPGDHVVHIDYGVGVFEGTKRMAHEEVVKDYIAIRYAGSDRVYVPVENLGLLDRYVGADDSPVRLDRLAGRSWLTAKARAARASAEYAAEILENRARRSVTRGFAFGPDAEWHRELEASFPHTLTPDQVESLDAVRDDMRVSRPMDRLVCGDVGYGKTEVALRAALRAAAATKQVAVIAPTTILCYQHYRTFKHRLVPLPLRVEMVSRFVAPAKRKQILEDLASGKVDIVIGTHLLLGRRVRFHDLGLLVLDEEQKFGVRQKERIKNLKTGVDILTLTATPVPRTLYMALSGLHDISTIHTPPQGRQEVLSEVSAWDDARIVDYVRRELDRDGQVFFVHNRIQSIRSVANRLGRLLPGIDIAVAHGQMPDPELERIYVDFAGGEHRILLSTAIIESGLDMPNVNTIIVDRADRFGLADLHQLRGRVGRSGRQAFALFLIPTAHDITPEARKRLSALLAYSKLGAGFKLALRDLEIRGAGDLLGTRQHGHIARVGLNLYAKMLKEAAARIKGEDVRPEPELSLDTTAYLPESYIPDSFERIALYRRIIGLADEKELAEFRTELVDRFGRYPPLVEELFKIARIRILAARLGLLKVTLKKQRLLIVTADRTARMPGDLDDLLQRLVRQDF
ncbi:MAG: transcription-repair coupling factor [candidate division WOR-3 bacterium]|nr:MAG: transcription-repair coupling factor [candidate division WOR-3 bacterium]